MWDAKNWQSETLICTLLVQNVVDGQPRWTESSWVAAGKRRISAQVSSEIFHGDRKIGFLQFQDWIFAHTLTSEMGSPLILETLWKKELVKLLPLTHLDDMVERDFVVFHLSQSLTVRDPSKVSRAVDPTICRKLARTARGLLSQLLPQLVCKKVCPYNNLYNQNIFVKKPVWTFLSWVVSQTILLNLAKAESCKKFAITWRWTLLEFAFTVCVEQNW